MSLTVFALGDLLVYLPRNLHPSLDSTIDKPIPELWNSCERIVGIVCCDEDVGVK